MTWLAVATAATDRRVGAASLEELRHSGALHLCANPDALPYSSRSDSKGLHGFQVELAGAVAQAMGLRLVVDWVTRPGAKTGCDASMDIIAGAALYQPEGVTGPLPGTPVRLRLTRPYAGTGVLLAVATGLTARHFAELDGQKIGVVVGSLAHEYLAKLGLNVSVYAVSDDIISAIESGEIAAGAVAAPVVGWYRHEHPDTRVMIPSGYEPEPPLCWNVAVGLWRADDALVEAMNSAIEELMKRGVVGRIYGQYGVAYYRPFADCGSGLR